jgi:hypothetical protein
VPSIWASQTNEFVSTMIMIGIGGSGGMGSGMGSGIGGLFPTQHLWIECAMPAVHPANVRKHEAKLAAIALAHELGHEVQHERFPLTPEKRAAVQWITP